MTTTTGRPSMANPVLTVQQILRRDLRRDDIGELCDSELAELVELLAHWANEAGDALIVRRRAQNRTLDAVGRSASPNPQAEHRLQRLADVLDAISITDTLSADLHELRDLRTDLTRVGRWVDMEIEDLTVDPGREGAA